MSDTFTPSAKVVEGILILTLPDAVYPVVWQMEIGQSKSSALEVRPDTGAEGHFLLMLKTARQDVLEIAKYETREAAVRALMTLSEAMEHAQGQMRTGLGQLPNGASHSPYDYSVPMIRNQQQDGPSKSALVKFVLKPLGYMAGALLLVVALLFLASWLIGIFSGAPSSVSGASSISSSSSTNTPVSAEDFLSGR